MNKCNVFTALCLLTTIPLLAENRQPAERNDTIRLDEVIGSEKLCGFDTAKVAVILDRYVAPMAKVNCMEKGCLEKRSQEG